MDVDHHEETVEVSDLEYVYLIRYLMIMRLVEKEELINTYKTIFPQDARAEHFLDAISTVNDMLKDAKMEVKEVKCEVSMQPRYVLFSTMYRPDKIWPSIKSEEELEFIKRVVHEIMISGRGVVSSIHCLNVDVKLSKSDRDDLLKTLIAEKWFTETKKGILAMSALCITELEPYLRNNYREVMNSCTFCKRTVYFGDLCSNCNVIGHLHCVNQYRKSMKKVFKCPACRKEWVSTQSTSRIDEMDCDESD